MQFWSKKKDNNFPDFWKNYLDLFDQKKENKLLAETRFVAFDTETTGFDYIDDRILSIGAVAINTYAIDVCDQLEVYLEQKVFNKDTVEIHGIRKNNDFDMISEAQALQQFITYVGDSILIAHHADFDRNMINSALQRQGLGKLKNRILDTGSLYRKTKHALYQNDRVHSHYSLDDLCNDLKISKSDRHTASGDAFITAMAFLKITPRLHIDKNIKINDLF